jgi:AcrR family transcriptional regulator
VYAVNPGTDPDPTTNDEVSADMATPTIPGTEPRSRLSRERVLSAAIAHADADGLEALSMRKLADELGVAPMALYRHVANRDDLVDGMVDVVFSEIDLPSDGESWRTAMRKRAVSVRDALLRHRWAIGLMESRRNPGPANLRHHDAVIASLRAAGFDMERVAHAYSVLDAYVYGFALTKMNLPFDDTSDIAETAQTMLEPFPVNEYPNLVAFIAEHAMKPGYDFADEFEYGLDLILDSLEGPAGTG